jgi:predicted nucleotidyltransferase
VLVIELVERIREAVRRRGGVRLAVLFGSRARGDAEDGSDVDLAVDAPGVDLLALADALGRELGLEVDVVTLDDPGVPLLDELVRDGVLAYEATRGRWAAWRSFALATLETDRPWHARMRDAWLLRVAREGL